MSFTVICNKCGEKQVFKKGDNPIGDYIEIGITENCGYGGCTVDTKDIFCSNCSNEINL